MGTVKKIIISSSELRRKQMFCNNIPVKPLRVFGRKKLSLQKSVQKSVVSSCDVLAYGETKAAKCPQQEGAHHFGKQTRGWYHHMKTTREGSKVVAKVKKMTVSTGPRHEGPVCERPSFQLTKKAGLHTNDPNTEF